MLFRSGVVVPGQPLRVAVIAANRGGSEVAVKQVRFDGLEQADACTLGEVSAANAYGILGGGGRGRGGAAPAGRPVSSLKANQVGQCTVSARVPAGARPSEPYWHRAGDAGRYTFDADAPFGLPYRPTPFVAHITLTTAAGDEIVRSEPVQYRYEGNIFSGEKRSELLVVPALSLRVSPQVAIIPEASIVAKDIKTGAEREVKADTKGYYILTNLNPSTYEVSAKGRDLGPSVYKEINLAVGQERNLNIVLQPATLAAEVTVSGGELTTIDTSSASVGANVNAREVGTLPLNGRQLSQLYLLAPGAQTAGGGSFDNIRFSGRANQENAIRFDGIESSSIIDASPGNLNGETSTGFRLQSSLENISEFRVESSNYPAEYGTGTAGQISVVTKSGGNDFHGGIFEYLRNSALDARNFYDGSSKAPLRLNQYGFSIGGPIKKDRTFFFVSQESLRQRVGVNLVATVPSASARARAVPSISPLLAGYPVGQTPSTTPDLDVFRGLFSAPIDEFFGSFRIDHRFSDNDSVAMRYARDKTDQTNPTTLVTGEFHKNFTNNFADGKVCIVHPTFALMLVHAALLGQAPVALVPPIVVG